MLPPRPKPGRKPGKKSTTARQQKQQQASNGSSPRPLDARQSLSPSEISVDSISRTEAITSTLTGDIGLVDTPMQEGTESDITINHNNNNSSDSTPQSIGGWSGFNDIEMDEDDEDKLKNVAYLNWAIDNLEPQKAVPLRTRNITNDRRSTEIVNFPRIFKRNVPTANTTISSKSDIDEVSYSTQSLQLPQEAYEMTIPKKPWGDSCGFCSNGTPCVCAENRDD